MVDLHHDIGFFIFTILGLVFYLMFQVGHYCKPSHVRQMEHAF